MVIIHRQVQKETDVFYKKNTFAYQWHVFPIVAVSAGQKQYLLGINQTILYVIMNQMFFGESQLQTIKGYDGSKMFTGLLYTYCIASCIQRNNYNRK